MSYRDELSAIGERADAEVSDLTSARDDALAMLELADAETTRLQGEVARLQAIIDGQTPEPVPVTELQVVAGDGQATLTWTAVPGATGYLVGRDGTDTGGSGPWETVDAPAVTSRTFLHLRNDVTYTLHVEPQGVASPRQTITVTPKAATTPPPTTGRGWLSGAGTVEVGNINPGKYLGDYRGSALEIGQTWQNTPDVWGIDPGVANSWANFTGAMCISCSPATWKGWAAIAAGADDAFWTAYAKTVHQRRAGKGQTYMAPFYEFNGTWMTWSVTRTAQGMADFRAAWARVAGIIRANAPTVRIVLAPAQGRDLPDAMVPATSTFDLLGGTNYNAWPWSPNGDAAMRRLETYRLHAERLGKPVGITEWANSGNPNEQGGGGEAPGFIRAVHAWLTKNRGTGAGQVEFETFFNIPGYALDHLIVQTNGQPSTTQPLTASAYRELWSNSAPRALSLSRHAFSPQGASTMTPTIRKALYGLIPTVVAVLTLYGVVTDNLAVLWGNVATLTVGFAYAASRATGDRFGDPEVRRALYVLVPAVVALIGGYWSVDVALWTSLAMAILGAALAGLNVDPDEQNTADYQPKHLEEGKDS